MTCLYLNSDQIGSGDTELGQILLQRFLQRIAQSDAPIDVVLCLHRGVHLTTQGSAVLESLEALQARGASVASCGTCLNYFELRGQLAIGEAGSMEDTVHILETADRVIAPC